MTPERNSTVTLHPDFAGTWDIDPAHSRIGFQSRHAMVAKVRGAFNSVTGSVRFDGDAPSDAAIEVRVDMASVDTRNAERDNHLRGADFFDVETYPEMVFVSTAVDEVEENSFIVTGDLTIRDVTRHMSIPLELLGLETDPFGQQRAGFEGSRRIDRKEFGVSWNTPLDSGGVLVSDKVTLEFELSLVKRREG
ncbi:YceI family protein [Citricoccus sp. NR2]|nr:YceI family protein [Citricoccus sp. NR2]WBL19960.1 YceI family protein [Citricoccus sp. NR2]